MDSFELNKIAGAVLGTLLATMAIGVLGDALFHAEAPEEPGWAVAVSEEGATEGGAAEEVTPLPVRLASADAGGGANVAKKCLSCHSFEAGGPNKVGPALHGVVGRQIAAVADFSYSGAFQERAAEGYQWTYDNLDAFLENPRGAIEGTAMAFAGVKDHQDRADLIAYLRSESPDAPPLPEPEAAPAAEAEAPAEGEAAPAAAEGEAAPAAAEAGAQPAAAEQQPAADAAPAQPAPGAEQGAAQPQAPAQQQAEPAQQPQAQQQAQAQQAAPAEQQAAPAEAAPAEAAAPAAGDSGLVAAVAAADPAVGEKSARKCVACHSFEQGGANKVGPALWSVVGRPIASVADYKYSEALQGLAGEWTLEELDGFLADPRGYAKGTKMAFAGVKKDDERHALLHYLYTLQENPQPLQ